MNETDSSDQKRFDALSSERRFELLVEAVKDYAIYLLDPEGHIRSWNSGAQRFKGYAADEIIGQHYSRFFTEEDRAAGLPEHGLRMAAAAGQYESEGWRVRKDGGRFWTSIVIDPIYENGELLGFAKVTRDITEARAAQEELEKTRAALQQSQKLEAIGKLTGGVAHDFNNLLQVVSGNLQLLARDIAGNERAERRVENALAGVSRGAKLASQLLAFARRQPLQPKVVNIGRFVGGMADMLRHTMGDAIQVEMIVSGGLWNTSVDPGQVENAVLNLALNARDAMDGAGKLTIEVGNTFLDDAYVRDHVEVQRGQYVMLAVTDTGSGMPTDLVAKAFEPFFTTKAEGKGTGLGLSMVYGFAKQSSGHVKIYSEVGHGTTVKLYLPRAMEGEDPISTPQMMPIIGGVETILVAEDDEEVRTVAVDLLTELGYRVLTAKDAEAALAIIESGAAVDMLFTDVVMPGALRSNDLAKRAKQRLPNLAVLFTSGYTENAIVHGGRLDQGVELLSKPYTREALAQKIRQVLEKRRRAAD